MNLIQRRTTASQANRGKSVPVSIAERYFNLVDSESGSLRRGEKAVIVGVLALRRGRARVP
jgi:hypothetical protein